jgi:copper homeostasis protein
MPADRNYSIEACVTSPEQAISAEQKGADRIELCVRLETEGMTPDTDLVQLILEHVRIPVRIMIRETETGYACDHDILRRMIYSISILKNYPIEGFVLGVTKQQRIDRPAMQILIEHCLPFPITFHKAIDLSEDVVDDIQWLNAFPTVDTLLTSGGAERAIDGVEQIVRMKSLFIGNIMAAGKIVPEMLPALHEKLDLNWYHGRSIV